VVLLLYTVIPLPLYMCVITGSVYTALYEVCMRTHPRPTLYRHSPTTIALKMRPVLNWHCTVPCTYSAYTSIYSHKCDNGKRSSRFAVGVVGC
jgi:hypothetical protein